MNPNIDNRRADDEIDLRSFFYSLRRKWHYFPISIILIALGVLLYLYFTLPKYEAKTSVLIKDSQKNSSGNIEDILSGDLFGNAKNIATEIGILQSRSVLSETIDELNIGISYYRKSGLLKTPEYKTSPFVVKFLNVTDGIYDEDFQLFPVDSLHFKISIETDNKHLDDFIFTETRQYGEEIKTPYFTLIVNRNKPAFPFYNNNKYYFRKNSENRLINELNENIKVEPLNKEATIVQISFIDEIPERALDFLNTLGSVYIERDIKDKTSVAGLTLKFIEEQLDEIRKALNNSELALQKFKEERGTVDLGEESKAYLERVSRIDEERVKAEIELRSLDYLYDYVVNKDVETLAPSSIGNPDPLLVELITRIKELQSRRMSLMYGSSSSSPAVKVIDDQIEQAKTALIENINSIRNLTKANLKGLNDQLDAYENSIKKVPNIERELLTIHRDFSVNENIYLYLLEKKAETSIAKATAVSDNKVLDVASLDDIPVSPDKKMIFVVSLLLAFLLPVTIIFMEGYIKNSISGREDVEKLTNIPIIGVVGHMNSSERLIVAAQPKSAVSEAFRSIRANLMFLGLDTSHKVILLTSSVGGEGKSFSTLNLAAVLSLQNHRVIIIGMDLRKPQLIEDLGVDNKDGISTLLIGKSTLERAIQKTNIEGLDIISSGPVPPNPAELLAKKEIKDLLEELKLKYDYIIIDTPPVGIVSDAIMLMNYSDINIFVLRENFSKKDYLRNINNYYSQGKVRNMCILLNDVSTYQRYGYGYDKGYYDQEKK